MYLLVQKISINNENISKCMSKIELFGLTSNFKLLCPALPTIFCFWKVLIERVPKFMISSN